MLNLLNFKIKCLRSKIRWGRSLFARFKYVPHRYRGGSVLYFHSYERARLHTVLYFIYNSCHLAPDSFFLHLIFIYRLCSCSRVLYLPSRFTFPRTSTAGNHKSQANPHAFSRRLHVVLLRAEHHFLLSRILYLSPRVMYSHMYAYIALSSFLRVCFFMPA